MGVFIFADCRTREAYGPHSRQYKVVFPISVST